MRVWMSAILACSFCLGLAQGVPTRNHRATSLLFLRFEPAQATLSAGQKELTFRYVNANDFRLLGSVFEDYEISRISGVFRQALGNNREWFLEVPLVSRGGGIMDTLIDWWHANVLQWGGTDRGLFPDYQSRLFLSGEYDKGSATGLGDVTIGVRQSFQGRFVVRAAIELPTGNQSSLLGSGGLDFGVSLDYFGQISSRWSFNAQLAIVVQGDSSFPRTNSIVDQESASLVYTPNSKDAWLVQWQSERAPARTGVSKVDGVHSLLTFGYRRVMGGGKTLLLYFSEDQDLLDDNFPALANIGPDFSFGISYSFKL